MNIKRIPILTVAVLTSVLLSGQETSYKYFPVQVAFVYPIGTHGAQSVRYTYDFSLNLLTGNTGNINGFEIGGLLNANKGTVSGAQVAGIGNITQGDIDGLQVGGLFSIADDLDGLQISGIFSRCSEAKGLQISGILSTSSSSEASISGIANINTGDQRGAQIAGIYNQAKKLNGVQIGLINLADTVESGIPIGLISLVKKGFYDEWNFSVADYQNLGLSYKLGIKQFYTIYTVGMNLLEDQLWVAGLGFGHLREINPRFSIQPEITCYTYYPMDFRRRIRDTFVNHFKLGLVYNVSEHFALSFAPSLYWALKSNRQTHEQYGYEQSLIDQLFKVERGGSRMEYGFGLSLAIQFR